MKSAAIYSRVSLPGQVDNYSLASQRRAMLALAKQQGFDVPKEFMIEDPGALGGELDRVGLTRLRELARSGAIRAVFCLEQDRLTRSLAHLLLLLEELEKHNVELHFVNGGRADASPETRALLSMKGVFSELEKTKIRERLTRGRREKAEQGHCPSTQVPYGYVYRGKAHGSKGRWVIEPHEAEGVRLMFRMAEAGAKLREIGLALEAQGFKPRKAASWAKTTISGILMNPAHAGSAIFNRRKAAEPTKRRKPAQPGQSKKTACVFRPSKEWIPVKVPAIVSPAQAKAVRAAIERTRQLSQGLLLKRVNLLRGLVRCGKCGYSCHSFQNHGKPYYRCDQAYSRQISGERRCTAHNAALVNVEAAVWELVAGYFEDPQRILAEWKRKTPKAAGAADRARLEAQIEKTSRREAHLVKLLMDPDLADNAAQVRAELKTAKIERQRAEDRLAAMAPAAGDFAMRLAPLACHLDGLGWRRTTLTERRAAITAVVDRVMLHEDRVIEVVFKFPMAQAGTKDRNRTKQESVAGAVGYAAA